MLDDQASYFKVGDNLYGIDGGHSRPSGCLHQFPDVLKQDANCLIIAHGIPSTAGAGFLHVKEALSFSVLYHTSVPSLSKLPETPLSEWIPGISDDSVLELANIQNALLLTADKDFGELVFRQRRASAGVILIRLSGLPAAHKAESVAKLVHEHGEEIMGSFSVIARSGTRIRRTM